MVPLDLEALGAAYWTGNGHKWLCGPKSAGVLVVREDRRNGVLPLVTGHGRNDARTDRPILWREFDWPGTADPTAFLALPDAIRLIGGLQPGGWPAHMAANHELAVASRKMLNERLGLEPIAPESMIGAMASIQLPEVLDEDGASAIVHSLADDERIEVPIVVFPVRGARPPGAAPSHNLLRISAQRYNEASDYERLTDALVGRRRSGVPAPASVIVAG